MNLKLHKFLHRDLTILANKRNISVELLIDQILSAQMVIEKHLSPDDHNTIKAIFRKYLPKVN